MPGHRLITTIDSHTAGHPTRVITGGLPPIKGETAAQKCAWFEQNCDEIRTLLLHEPRGHAAMVGAVLHDSATADYGAFFLGSYNYLPMCGHATIGIAATLDYLGLLKPNGINPLDAADVSNAHNSATFTLEVPAGKVTVSAHYEQGRLSSVRFDNVAAYIAAPNVGVNVLTKPLICDIAYGGNWYALVEAKAANVTLDPGSVQEALRIGAAIKEDINQRIAAGAITGAADPIHSVLFYETSFDGAHCISAQLVVLARNKFDRSPCGTGTSARLAQLLQQGLIAPGEAIRARNILGVDFKASATRLPAPVGGPHALYQPTIEGLAHITGQHSFIVQDNDPIPGGFLCR